MLLLILVHLLLYLHSIACFHVRYDNYTLFMGTPQNEEQLEFFEGLKSFESVKYWIPPGSINHSVEFIMGPGDRELIMGKALFKGIFLKIIIKNIQRAFDLQTVTSYTRKNMKSFNWYNYFPLEDIYAWMSDISTNYKNITELITIGKTQNSRPIKALKINLGIGKVRSRAIIEGGIHAREWISPAAVTFLIESILHSGSSRNLLLKTIAKTYEWYFIPVLNPDGYHYTFHTDRMWRKNRHCYKGGCGVDLNRNFPYAFATVGASKRPKDETFCGPNAFSEYESKSIGDFIMLKRARLEYYISLHAYGQYMILPYANSMVHLDNFDEARAKCKEAERALRSMYGTKYQIGTAYDTIGYLTSGVSSCWVKKAFKVPYVLSLELRDKGEFGFALPSDQISETCMETLAGVLSFMTPSPYKPKPNVYGLGNRKHLKSKAIFERASIFVIVIFIVLSLL